MNSATMHLLRGSQERIERSLKLIQDSDELIRELDTVILERTHEPNQPSKEHRAVPEAPESESLLRPAGLV